MGATTLVLGGTRSGKSAVAERLAAGLAGPDTTVTYVATAMVGEDTSMAERVAAHRSRRPASWTTVDAGGDLPALLRSLDGVVLLDALGPWVAWLGDSPVPVDDLCAALVERAGETVVVSEEVGLSVHPPTAAGRAFVDALGSLNQSVAAVADDAWLVVAGRVLALASPAAVLASLPSPDDPGTPGAPS